MSSRWAALKQFEKLLPWAGFGVPGPPVSVLVQAARFGYRNGRL